MRIVAIEASRLIGSLLVASMLLVNASGCSLSGSASDAPLTQSLGGCAPFPCVKVHVSSMPELPSQLSANARERIAAEVRRSLYAPLNVDTDQYSADNLEGELKARLEEYKSVTDAPIDWSLTREATVIFSGPEVTSVEVLNEGYLGGAHGFKERSLMTFDSKSGTRLSVSDIVDESSKPILSKMIEAEFRRERAVPTGQSLQDAGFFILPGQEMPIGENFALTDRFLEIQYNPYEVAPFALGETRVRVPREAVEPLVKADRRQVFSGESAPQKR
jgi:hypothetical protein